MAQWSFRGKLRVFCFKFARGFKKIYNERKTADKLTVSRMELADKIKKDRISPVVIASMYLNSGLKYNLKHFINVIEKLIIIEALKLNNNIQTKAADSLGISYKAIRIRIKKHKITKNSFSQYEFNNYINDFDILSLDQFLFDIEKAIINEVMEYTGQKVVRAANILGLKHNTLSMKLKKHKSLENG